MGAAIGIVDKAGQLLSLHQLEQPYKVEGISAQVVNDTLNLLLVTDADDPAVPSKLLSASFPL
nr:hypothetical protein [Rhizobium rhizogenes]